ncbi:MAG: DUF2206 domain-containing protein, partial [Dehalococcoidia bacterium]|nr:DUF2206 domain-containing protein [Dehalococcoidia bacterium]
AGLIGLAYAGLDIPVLRQVIGFIFLTIIPGSLILRILKIHEISALESLVYSAGLSIAFVMFSGALIDLILPLVGVRQPLSLLPVTITIGLLVLILMLIAWVRDRDYMPLPAEFTVKALPLIPVLSLILLLALTVLAVALVDTFQNNILLLICLALIVVVVVLAAFDKFIHPELYPLAIFVIGLCLLYQTTLMSPYPIGSDIFTEYRFYRMAMDAGVWDASIFEMVNTCLSITILAPVYSLFLGLDGNWLFKVVYPLIFTLVPLCLYSAFSRQIGAKKAFLSVFFFVSVPTFSLEMIALCRQQIAELFLALLILLLVERKLKPYQRLFLLCIFAVSIVVSHYALGLISFVSLIFILLVLLVINIRSYCRRSVPGQPHDAKTISPLNGTIGLKTLIILIAVFLIAAAAWYSLVGSGLMARSFGNIWFEQTRTVTEQMWKVAPVTSPPAASVSQDAIQFNNRDGLIRAALGLDFAGATPAGKVFRIIQYITQLLLIIGFIKTFFRPGKSGFKPEFLSLSLAAACLLLVSLILPRFADYFNITRLYHIALMTLSPFCILGGEAVWLWAVSVCRKFRRGTYNDSGGGLRFVTLAVLLPYFVFTSGIIYEVTGHNVTGRADLPYSIAMSSYRLDLAGVLSSRDGAAAQWASLNSDNVTGIYADRHAANLLNFFQFQGPLQEFSRDANNPQEGSYLFLDSVNVSRGQITFALSTGLRQYVAFSDIPGLTAAMEQSNRIYNNSGGQVFFLSVP